MKAEINLRICAVPSVSPYFFLAPIDSISKDCDDAYADLGLRCLYIDPFLMKGFIYYCFFSEIGSKNEDIFPFSMLRYL